MSLQDDARRPGAGRPIPEEEETPSRTSALAPRGRRLTQRTLFQYGTKAARSQQGKSKRSQDYSLTTQESLPWGDYHASGREAKEKGYFRILSHNVNGLSKANHPFLERTIFEPCFTFFIMSDAIIIWALRSTLMLWLLLYPVCCSRTTSIRQPL